MRPAWKFAGLAGGGLGAALATTAVATVATSRRIARQRHRAPRSEPLGTAAPDRETTVIADDGVALSVAEVDPADGGAPELTVVLVHGYILDRRSWHFQRADLAASTAPRVRQVLYDQRSHGRSGRCPDRGATIDHLAHDLDAVIRATVPDGPVVLVGHSMGGMTIMALAEHHPELFADRVCGVALINTAAGDVGSSGLPRPVLSPYNPFLAWLGRLAAWQPGAVERGRALGNDLIWGLIKTLAFGDRKIDHAAVDLMETMISGTPVDVMTAFLPTMDKHDRYAALAGLRHVQVLVLGSDADRLTPYRHAEAITALLPDAELVQIPDAGHMAMLEQPSRVGDALLKLLSRCSARAAPA